MTIAWQNRIVGHADVRPATLVPNPRNWRTHPGGAATSPDRRPVARSAGSPRSSSTGPRATSSTVTFESSSPWPGTNPPCRSRTSSSPKTRSGSSWRRSIRWRRWPRPRRTSSLRSWRPRTRRRGPPALLDDLGREAGIESIRAGLVDPDDVPDVPDEPTVQRGELYLLGDHRLLCGDSTDPAMSPVCSMEPRWTASGPTRRTASSTRCTCRRSPRLRPATGARTA